MVRQRKHIRRSKKGKRFVAGRRKTKRKVYVIVDENNKVVFSRIAPFFKLKDAKKRLKYERERPFGEKGWRIKSFIVDKSEFIPVLGFWEIKGRKLKFIQSMWQGD